MKLVFDFDMNDWMAFQKVHLENSKQFNRMKMFVTWMFPGVWIFIMFLELSNGSFKPAVAVVMFVVSVLWVIFYPKRFKNSTLKRAKKILSEGDNSGIIGEHQLELTDQSIKSDLPQSSSTINWDGIKKFIETDQYYFLYNTAASAIIIPKFKLKLNETEKSALAQILKTKIAL
jgi:hypothetical protein